MSKNSPKLPRVLAFARSLNPGHLLMYSASSLPEEAGDLRPVLVRQEPLRGLNATAKTPENKRHEAVLQVVESAELVGGDDTLVLRGKLLVRNNLRVPYSCNEAEFPRQHGLVVDTALADGTLAELTTRYAINLLSGLWGWTNALASESVTVTVTWKEAGASRSVSATDLLLEVGEGRFDVSRYPAHREAIMALAGAVAAAVGGQCRGTLFRVQGAFVMGEGARVYPSQEWASETQKAAAKKDWDDGSGKSSGVTRVLAKVLNRNGDKQAIINDRKAGNALRVVDTWYAEAGAAAIAAEVYGANSHQGLALRSDGNSFFKALAAVADGKQLSADDTKFYLAVCIRGGVFGSKE